MNSVIQFLLSAVLFMVSVIPGHAEVVLNDIQGQKTPFSALKGKWVFINYWAGWCQTCLDEIPEFNRFYQQHKNDPVALYAVNFDALPLFEQRNLIRRFNINYPSLLNDPATDLRLGDITGVPVTFIFNPKGQLVKTLYGGQSVETLNQVIAENQS
ncbi:TlpA disulfide reductase family protein [Legionella quateirensis]|uniref:Thiol-disulfide oxidoreductase n=1 Tax=Legionella quateirensis TaxID=45072 RepID=A0A378KMU2_9GAMM|nr:TlpA disulfide reductase family protein [Legionella quateirensis]KTD42372.1 thiol-disulfide oxidoreductase ResA [Legionella quateirensis]STY16234.1 thiol-disulfide oxidoreductase [Legionella quateirensis]